MPWSRSRRFEGFFVPGGWGGGKNGSDLNKGELPDNTSAIAGEATNASSEDFLEEDNESVELNGNLSGSKLV